MSSFNFSKRTGQSTILNLNAGGLKSQLKSAGLHSTSTKNVMTANYFRDHSPSSSPNKSRNRSNDGMRVHAFVIVINCQRHSNEVIKFIDVSTPSMLTHCELCLVDPQVSVSKMKLERIVDLQDRMRQLLLTNIHQLKELELKVENMTKEINVTNALRNPLMEIIDHMEKKISKQVEYVFKRLRERFTVVNPLADVKTKLKDKIENLSTHLRNLDSQTDGALITLKDLLKDSQKLKEEMLILKTNVHKRLEEAKNFNPTTHKDFGFVQNAYEEFAESIKKLSERFVISFMK